MTDIETSKSLETRSWKYKIEQTAKGARITVHGDDLGQTIDDYTFLRTRLQQAGFRIAPEE